MGSSLWHVGFSLVVAFGFFFPLSNCGVQGPEHMSCVVCSTRALSLRCVSSVVVARGLSCPMACGILVPGQGSYPHPLHWKADSLPLDHPGSPETMRFLNEWCGLSVTFETTTMS